MCLTKKKEKEKKTNGRKETSVEKKDKKNETKYVSTGKVNDSVAYKHFKESQQLQTQAKDSLDYGFTWLLLSYIILQQFQKQFWLDK